MPNCSETNFKCGEPCTRPKNTTEPAYYKDCKTGSVGVGRSYTDAIKAARKTPPSKKLDPKKRKKLLKDATCDRTCEAFSAGTKQACELAKLEAGCGGGPIDNAVETLAPKVDDSERCTGCNKGDIGCAIGKTICEFTGATGEGLNNCFGLGLPCGVLMIIALAAVVLIMVLK